MNVPIGPISCPIRVHMVLMLYLTEIPINCQVLSYRDIHRLIFTVLFRDVTLYLLYEINIKNLKSLYFIQIKQVTLVAATRLTLDWIQYSYHLFVLFFRKIFVNKQSYTKKSIIFIHIGKSKSPVTLLYLSIVNDIPCLFLHHVFDIFIGIFRENFHPFNSPLRYIFYK